MLGLSLDLGAAAARAAPAWVLRDAAGRLALLDIDYEHGRFWHAGRLFADEAALLAAAGGTKPGAATARLPWPLPGQRPGEAAIFAEVTAPASLAANQSIVQIVGASHLERLDLQTASDDSGWIGFISTEGGAWVGAVGENGMLPPAARRRIAGSARAGRVALATHGDPPDVSADAADHVVALQQLHIGTSATGFGDFAGTIHRVAVLPAAQPDGWLSAVTAPDGAIAAWGDSLAAAAFAGGDFAALFAPQRVVFNGGIGAQTSKAIAARQGAVPIRLTLAGGMIPMGVESVAVAARSVSPVTYQGPWIGAARAMTGTLAGVWGTLARGAEGDDAANDSAAMSFTRMEAGAAVACPPGSRFVPDVAAAMRRRIALVWAGRNNAEDAPVVLADIAAMAASLGHGRYLVGAVLTAAGDAPGSVAGIEALNAALAAAHGGRFVDLLGTLKAAHDGSPGDLADVAAGLTPRSLRSDGIHLNAAGNAVARAAWRDAVLAAGW